MTLPRVRFTVRTMMALILTLGCGFGWVVHRAHVQRDAVAAIQRAGGYVRYDWMFPNDRYNPNSTPPVPKWLVDLLGIDYFGNVVWVVFRPGKGETDSDLARVAVFDRLGVLTLHSPKITDAGLESVKDLRGLGSLCVHNCKITDAGLVKLNNLNNLEAIIFRDVPITDAGLLQLRSLKNLRELTLENTAVTDAGVAALRELIPGLRVTR